MNQVAVDGAPQVDACAAADLARLEPQWRDLAGRAGEPNPFGESAFLVSATRHLAPRRLTGLCVWRGPSRSKLDALAIIRRPRFPFAIVDVWRSELAGLAALLVDGDMAIGSLEALIDWLARERPAAAALGLPNVDIHGKLARALRAVAQKRHLRLETSNPRRRAALDCGPGANFASLLDTRRSKEWRRVRRRLEERGRLEFAWSHEPAAIEDFLGLEAAGWKGVRGTALAAEAHRAAFARDMLYAFASLGRLGIARLTLDSRTIAAAAVLRSGARAFYWKTAFDETLSAFSPGVQLTLAMSRSLETDSGLCLADSCADPNHPMIDRLWTGRIDLADFALATSRKSSMALPFALAARRAEDLVREGVKRRVRRTRSAAPR